MKGETFACIVFHKNFTVYNWDKTSVFKCSLCVQYQIFIVSLQENTSWSIESGRLLRRTKFGEATLEWVTITAVCHTLSWEIYLRIQAGGLPCYILYVFRFGNTSVYELSHISPHFITFLISSSIYYYVVMAQGCKTK